jgi:hypothetical protein
MFDVIIVKVLEGQGDKMPDSFRGSWVQSVIDLVGGSYAQIKVLVCA